MKRSKMIYNLCNYYNDYHVDDNINTTWLAEITLEYLEKAGMKPPLSTCKMVEDTYNGGTKHGPVEHKWDEE